MAAVASRALVQKSASAKLTALSAVARRSAAASLSTSASNERQRTSLSEVLDRTANAMFMTEIFRGLWLTAEVAFKPKVTINYPHEKGPLSTR